MTTTHYFCLLNDAPSFQSNVPLILLLFLDLAQVYTCLFGLVCVVSPLLLLECSIRGSPFVTSPTSFGPQTGNHSPSSMAFRSIIDFITSLSINSRLKFVMFINEYVHPASISVFTTLFLSYLGSNLYPILIHLKPVQTQKRLIQVSYLDVPHLHK